jgi:hypothetical protein
MESHHPDHSLTDKEDWYNVIKDIEDGLPTDPVRRIRQLPQSYCTYACYRSAPVPNSDIDGLPTGTDTPGIAAIPIDIDEDEDIHIISMIVTNFTSFSECHSI